MKKNKKIEQEKLFKSGEVISILENMSDGIQLVSEQHGEIVKRLDGIDNRLDGIDDRLDGIDGRLDGIDGRLDGIDGRLDGIDGRLDRMQEDMTDIKHELKRKVDHEEFEKLEKRVIKIDKLVLAR